MNDAGLQPHFMNAMTVPGYPVAAYGLPTCALSIKPCYFR